MNDGYVDHVDVLTLKAPAVGYATTESTSRRASNPETPQKTVRQPVAALPSVADTQCGKPNRSVLHRIPSDGPRPSRRLTAPSTHETLLGGHHLSAENALPLSFGTTRHELLSGGYHCPKTVSGPPLPRQALDTTRGHRLAGGHRRDPGGRQHPGRNTGISSSRTSWQ